MVFTDSSNSFNSINREALWNVLSRFGCPIYKLYTTVLRLLHDKMTATFLINGTETEPFTIRTEMKHGCVIAPTLFTINLCSMLFLVRHRRPRGVKIDYRLDGKHFNLSRSSQDQNKSDRLIAFSMLMTVSFLPTQQKSFRQASTLLPKHVKDHIPIRSRQL